MSTTTQNITFTLATYDAIRTAIQQRAPLSIVYATRGDVVKERVIEPLEIVVGRHGSDLIWAWDSIRGTVLSFRIDRVVAYRAAPTERV
jgi:predicted DNA-binding transcriptional regulator YafY